MSLNLENIVFEDSYLLGWKKSRGAMQFYLELLLNENHPLFTRYDEKTEYGCFKRANLTVIGADSVAGLPTDGYRPKWNEQAHEYDDVAEIDSLIVIEDRLLKIEADEYNIEVSGESIRIEFE